jgi:hypothetical protein
LTDKLRFSLEKVLTVVKKNYRKRLHKVRGPDPESIRASSHPSVSIAHQRDESMNST